MTFVIAVLFLLAGGTLSCVSHNNIFLIAGIVVGAWTLWAGKEK